MATLTQTQLENATLLRLSGGLTFEGVGPLARPFDAAAQAGGTLIVDLSDVPVITTPGLSLLLATLRRSQHHGGRLVLAGATRNIRDLLRRCRLDRVFEMVDDASQVAAGATAQSA